MVTIPKWVVYNIVLSTLERMQRHQLVSVSFDRGDFKGWVMFLTPKTRGMQQPDTRSEPKWAVEKLIFWSRQNFGCVKRGTSPADIHQPLLEMIECWWDDAANGGPERIVLAPCFIAVARGSLGEPTMVIIKTVRHPNEGNGLFFPTAHPIS